jgi:hypothetical protein
VPSIELLFRALEVGKNVDREVGSSWEVLSQEPVGVLVAGALPRAPGIAEVDLYAIVDAELKVLGPVKLSVYGSWSWG